MGSGYIALAMVENSELRTFDPLKDTGRIKFFNGSEFLNLLLAFRILWIDGRHGGGKTSLSIIIAAWLKAQGKVEKIVSNIPCVFADPVVSPLTSAAIIMDEAWIYMDTRQAIFDYAAFVRKFEHYLIMPSVWEVHSKLSFFTCYRMFNGYAYGLPFWFYNWKLKRSTVKDKGWFVIINPENIFGLYPDKFVPGDDAGIYEAIGNTAKNAGYKGKQGRNNLIMADIRDSSENDQNRQNNDDLEGLFESQAFRMAETVEDMEDAVKKFSFFSKKLRR